MLNYTVFTTTQLSRYTAGTHHLTDLFEYNTKLLFTMKVSGQRILTKGRIAPAVVTRGG